MGSEIFDPEIWARVPFHFWSAVIFIFGCLVGSFLNVCIYRMPLGKSVVTPASHCPYCGYAIPFYLNVPLVTWLMLRGKCANCSAPISIRYFLVELLTGLMFLACWLTQGMNSPALALVYCLVAAGLIVATFIDIEHFIIPDEITFGGMVTGFVCSAAVPALHDATGVPASLRASFIGILVGGVMVQSVRLAGKLAFGRLKIDLANETKVVFTEEALVLPDREVKYEEMFSKKTDAIRFHARRLELLDRCFADVSVSLSPIKLRIGEQEFDPELTPYMEALTTKMVLPREAMGFGDVTFMGAIGAFLGWQATIFSLMAASLIGTIVAGAMILLGKRERSAQIPFGPYIAAGAVIWMFCGPQLVSWFLSR
ncbi:MAG TPA: prepilin peptidase [Candidatus Acidoferrum sp.]|nr:prepilin peptidase [Candidatus Acidoferrum sp.]